MIEYGEHRDISESPIPVRTSSVSLSSARTNETLSVAVQSGNVIETHEDAAISNSGERCT